MMCLVLIVISMCFAGLLYLIAAKRVALLTRKCAVKLSDRIRTTLREKLHFEKVPVEEVLRQLWALRLQRGF